MYRAFGCLFCLHITAVRLPVCGHNAARAAKPGAALCLMMIEPRVAVNGQQREAAWAARRRRTSSSSQPNFCSPDSGCRPFPSKQDSAIGGAVMAPQYTVQYFCHPHNRWWMLALHGRTRSSEEGGRAAAPQARHPFTVVDRDGTSRTLPPASRGHGHSSPPT